MKASLTLVSFASMMFALACGGEASLGAFDGGATSSSGSGGSSGSGAGTTSATGATGTTTGSGTTTGDTTTGGTGGATGTTTTATSGSGGNGTTSATTGGSGGKSTTSGGGSGGASGGAGGAGGATTDAGRPNPCDTVKCTAGTHCVVEPVACLVPPCPGLGVAHCVPDTRVMCGGIAAIQCPGAGTCVDDPSDTCNPKQGGADCPAICECAATKCAAGSHFDMSPSVCTCVPD